MEKKKHSKLMQYLIDQCHNPKGIVGNIMIRIWNKTFIKMALWGLSHTNLEQTDVLLEIGCGGGVFIHYLAKRKCAHKIYGIDISKIAIQKASALNKEFIQNNTVALSQNTVDALPFSEMKFQKVFAVQTHMYWSEIEEAITKIYALVTEGGEFNIICEKDKIEYHLSQYKDKKTMTKMVKQCGFDTVHVFETNKWIHYQCIKTEGIRF